MNFNTVKNIIGTILALYSMGMCIYSGYTADNNKPDDDSNGLFIASYVICIIHCIIYLFSVGHIIYCLFSNNNTETEKDTNEYSSISISTLINIYWLVIYFNYNVSEKYNEYALVKTVEFFILLGIIFISIFIIFPGIIFWDYSNGTSKNINNSIESQV